MTLLKAQRSLRKALVVFLIAASVGLAVTASRLERLPGDLPVAEWVQSISIPLFDELMRGVSGVGWWIPGSIITVCLGAALFVRGRRSDAGLFVAVVAVGAGVNWAIKQLVASPRPDSELLQVHEELTTYGFPSGHVMFAVVCFGGLAVLLSGAGGRYAILRRIAQVTLVLLVAAMAFSRVYLGAHWPSDTVGAIVIGSMYLLVLAGRRGVIESARLQRSGPVGRRP